MTTRIRECDERISAGRLRKALQFRDAAKTIREFADNQAIAELSRVRPGGEELSSDLRALLQMKPRAEYGPVPVTGEQRKRAWRRAERLVEAARRRSG